MTDRTGSSDAALVEALQRIHEILREIRDDLRALKQVQEQAGSADPVREEVVGGTATYSDLTANKYLPRRMG